MTGFFQAAAGVLLAAILGLMLSKQWKEAAMLLTIAACCMVAAAAVSYLKPVVALMVRLQDQANLDSEFLGILLKVVGIGLIAEIAALICSDAGNASLGKVLQVLASAVILWLSIPLLNELMTLVSDILGGL